MLGIRCAANSGITLLSKMAANASPKRSNRTSSENQSFQTCLASSPSSGQPPSSVNPKGPISAMFRSCTWSEQLDQFGPSGATHWSDMMIGTRPARSVSKRRKELVPLPRGQSTNFERRKTLAYRAWLFVRSSAKKALKVLVSSRIALGFFSFKISLRNAICELPRNENKTSGLSDRVVSTGFNNLTYRVALCRVQSNHLRGMEQ